MIKANRYFEGQVQSLAFCQQDQELSIGVMLPGAYTFGTAAPERMTVVKGALTVKLAPDAEWVTYRDGESFNVAGDASFDLQVEQPTAYLCEYLN
ncbi:pyrimidine/purine nucleoside phosphorylase [Vibrio sp. JPW-9-11-11]|uniref:pyrimidine/purine nucleoside phosphorylase n=1 Tax=Vibrio sp. JPW-9-11-11 TaxID=1416532 RepID=UPI001594E3D6|nr:pyrimidine/purine nucleoside phosphorylase [Vibrio sp. JPW-9-11-11]NVD08498.1 pyrimidine/purine nucleoside phosphorylase [Vibrio sp. JPW-9-11-11]